MEKEMTEVMEREMTEVMTFPLLRVPNLDMAVRKAAAMALPGDAVLLAPACSSFDAFRDYAARGDRFRDLARELARELARTTPSPGTREGAGEGAR